MVIISKELCQMTNITASEAAKFTLEYYIITSAITLEKSTIITYGIEIHKIAYLSLELREIKSITDISTNENKVRHLIKTLANGHVTPTSLYDIIYDWVSEQKNQNNPCQTGPLMI